MPYRLEAVSRHRLLADSAGVAFPDKRTALPVVADRPEGRPNFAVF
ncbi:MAG: hypothetical protein JSR90_17380 [Proteobacteria bacterium]|nr:hypothetical protein [Pseudomonadota bacterium]